MNDDRMLLKTAFAVVVIVGWLVSVLWLSLSVAQIAVDHASTTTVSETGASCVSGALP